MTNELDEIFEGVEGIDYPYKDTGLYEGEYVEDGIIKNLFNFVEPPIYISKSQQIQPKTRTLMRTMSVMSTSIEDEIEGDGSEINPFIIRTPEQFELIKTYTTSYFELGNDIDFNGGEWTSSNTVGQIKFDGKYHTVKNVKILPVDISTTSNPSYHASFFGRQANSIIKNCKFENLSIERLNNDRYANTALICTIFDGVLQNIDVKGSIIWNGGFSGSMIISGGFGIIGTNLTQSVFKHISVETDLNIKNVPSTSVNLVHIGGLCHQIYTTVSEGYLFGNSKLTLSYRNPYMWLSGLGFNINSASKPSYHNSFFNSTKYNTTIPWFEHQSWYSSVGIGYTESIIKAQKKMHDNATGGEVVELWSDELGELPYLRMNKLPQKRNIKVVSYTSFFKSTVLKKVKRLQRLVSYIKPIKSKVTAAAFEAGTQIEDSVASYMAFINSDKRIHIKIKRTSYVLNINGRSKPVIIKNLNLLSYLKPVNADVKVDTKKVKHFTVSSHLSTIATKINLASIGRVIRPKSYSNQIHSDINVSYKNHEHLVSHLSPIQTDVKRVRKANVIVSSYANKITSSVEVIRIKFITPITYMNSINANVTFDIKYNVSSYMNPISSKAYPVTRIHVVSHMDKVVAMAHTDRNNVLRVVGYSDSLESSVQIGKTKVVHVSSHVNPITSDYDKTQIKYVTPLSYLGAMGARVIKGGYVRFNSWIPRNTIVSDYEQYRVKWYKVDSHIGQCNTEANAEGQLTKVVSSYINSINGDVRVKPNFFLPKMIEVRGRIITNKSITRYTGNINSSHSDDWGF